LYPYLRTTRAGVVYEHAFAVPAVLTHVRSNLEGHELTQKERIKVAIDKRSREFVWIRQRGQDLWLQSSDREIPFVKERLQEISRSKQNVVAFSNAHGNAERVVSKGRRNDNRALLGQTVECGVVVDGQAVHAAATFDSQNKSFQELAGRYPMDTRFIVLPMDLRGTDRGQPDQDIEAQHLELARLAKNYTSKIIPFVHVDPNSSRWRGPDPVTFIKKLVEDGLEGVKFKGIKLYPPLGYLPSDPKVRDIFRYANEKELPVMVHCSSGIVRDMNLSRENATSYAAPCNYVDILRDFPNMRLCLGHFGGQESWNSYLSRSWFDPSIPGDPTATDWEGATFRDMDWVSQITTMMKSGEFPNLYADISYTVFSNEDRFLPMLSVLLTDPAVAQ